MKKRKMDMKTALSLSAATNVDAIPSPGEGRRSGAADKRAHRTGKVNITGYLPPSYRQQLHLVQAQKPERASIQELIAEALNLLFEKYKIVGVR